MAFLGKVVAASQGAGWSSGPPRGQAGRGPRRWAAGGPARVPLLQRPLSVCHPSAAGTHPVPLQHKQEGRQNGACLQQFCLPRSGQDPSPDRSQGWEGAIRASAGKEGFLEEATPADHLTNKAATTTWDPDTPPRSLYRGHEGQGSQHPPPASATVIHLRGQGHACCICPLHMGT